MNAAMPEQFDVRPDRNDLGAVLRDARERFGYSVADVAKQLHLNESVITALESNDPGELPPGAFVKGYLRAYAKLVDLDGEALVEQFNRSTAASDPDIGPVTHLRAQFSAGDPVIRWMSVIIIVVLAVMVAVWWQTNNGDSDSAPETVQSTSPAVVEAEPVVVPEPVVQVEQPVLPEASAALTADNEVSAQPAPEPATSDEQLVVEAQDATEAVVAEPVQEVTPTAAVEAQAVQVVPEPEVEPTAMVEDPDAGGAGELAAATLEPVDEMPAGPPAPPPDVLMIIAFEPSWVEVSDANGERLFYSLHDSNDDLRLFGTAPFLVFLGNSPDVEVRLNDVTMDQTTFNRSNNTARFLVTADGVRTP